MPQWTRVLQTGKRQGVTVEERQNRSEGEDNDILAVNVGCAYDLQEFPNITRCLDYLSKFHPHLSYLLGQHLLFLTVLVWQFQRHWCFLYVPLMGLFLAVTFSPYFVLQNSRMSKDPDQARPSPFISKVFLRRSKWVRTRISRFTTPVSSNALNPGKIKFEYVPYLNSSVKLCHVFLCINANQSLI